MVVIIIIKNYNLNYRLFYVKLQTKPHIPYPKKKTHILSPRLSRSDYALAKPDPGVDNFNFNF